MNTEDKLEDIQWVIRRYTVNSIEDVIELRQALLDGLSAIYDHSENLSTEEVSLLEEEQAHVIP